MARNLESEHERQEFSVLWHRAERGMRYWVLEADAFMRQGCGSARQALDLLNRFSAVHRFAQTVWTAKEFLDAYLTEHAADVMNFVSTSTLSFSALECLSMDNLKRLGQDAGIADWDVSFPEMPDAISLRAPDLALAIDEHLGRFFWTGASYAEIQGRDVEFLLHHLLSPYPKKAVPSAPPLFALHTIDPAHLQLANLLFPFLEARREVLMKASVLVHRLFELLGRRHGLYANQSKWLTLEEWDMMLAGTTPDMELLGERMNASFIEWRDGVMQWSWGVDAWSKERDFRSQWFSTTEPVVRGDVVVPTEIQGRAFVLVENNSDALRQAQLRAAGAPLILVTGMTTPELIPLLDYVSAVVTDEGGITCHAATICRERGKPCLINTRLGTKLFATGDLIVLEHDQARVLCRAEHELERPIDVATHQPHATLNSRSRDVYRPMSKPVIRSLEEPSLQEAREVGGKAKRIAQLRQLGFPAPPGFVLYSSASLRWGALSDEDVRAAVARHLPGVLLFAVRSAVPDEDIAGDSRAGHYTTHLSQPLDRLRDSILQTSEEIFSLGAASLCVLVQPMLEVRASGVAFCPNIPGGRLDQILIEAAPGAGGVVDGRSTPQRYQCRRLSGIVERVDLNLLQEPALHAEQAPNFRSVQALLPPVLLEQIVKMFNRLDRSFGFDLDVEWAVTVQEQFQVLQVRPLSAAAIVVPGTTLQNKGDRHHED